VEPDDTGGGEGARRRAVRRRAMARTGVLDGAVVVSVTFGIS
jgi:hypothetical protein